MLDFDSFTFTANLFAILLVLLNHVNMRLVLAGIPYGQSLPRQPGSTKKHWPLRPLRVPAGQDVVVVPPQEPA